MDFVEGAGRAGRSGDVILGHVLFSRKRAQMAAVGWVCERDRNRKGLRLFPIKRQCHLKRLGVTIGSEIVDFGGVGGPSMRYMPGLRLVEGSCRACAIVTVRRRAIRFAGSRRAASACGICGQARSGCPMRPAGFFERPTENTDSFIHFGHASTLMQYSQPQCVISKPTRSARMILM